MKQQMKKIIICVFDEKFYRQNCVGRLPGISVDFIFINDIFIIIFFLFLILLIKKKTLAFDEKWNWKQNFGKVVLVSFDFLSFFFTMIMNGIIN